MKKMKKIASAMVLSGVIMMGVNTAQAGVIVNLNDGTKNPSTCSESINKSGERVDHGVIVNLTGVIVNFTGVIVNLAGDIFGDKKADTPVNCGVIVN